MLFSDPPRYTNITGNIDVFANGVNKIIVSCSTDSASPAASITWFVDDHLVYSNKTIILTNGDHGGQVTSQELEFVPSREMDGQIVECKASNGLSFENTASSTFALDLRCKYYVTRIVLHCIFKQNMQELLKR